jgi:TolB-like protein/predicted Zn-dependent protease
LSWRYDIGEHGIVRTRRGIEDDDTPPEGLKAVDYLLLLVLLGIGGAALYQLLPVAQQADEAQRAVADGALPELAPNSIAVLPFADISQGGDQQFLGDGISDTVMHVLSQIGELSVTARTSSFAFKGQNVSVKDIAKVLSVAHVLEGSVQRAGDKVRIIARLIDARVGTEVWSGYYDRAVDSIFAIQDEIAQEVAAALTTKVLKRDKGVEIEQDYRPSLAAYEKFILGKQALSKPTKEDAREAVALFSEAIAEDPDYALAYVYKTIAVRVAATMQTHRQVLEEAAGYVAKALDLDPQLAEAHGENASILISMKRLPEAEAALKRALELQPSYAEGYAKYSNLHYMRGELDEALTMIRKAVELDPQEERYKRQLAQALWAVGRAEEAVARAKDAIERNPTVPSNYRMLSRWMEQMGEVGRSAYLIEHVARMDDQNPDVQRLRCLALTQLWARERALECYETYLEAHPGDTEAMQHIAILTRDQELGLENMRKAVAETPKFWYRRYQLSDWLVQAEEWEETIETLKPAAPKIFEATPTVDDFTSWAVRNAGQALFALGEEAQATAMLEAGLDYLERRRKLKAAGFVAGVEDVYYLLILGRVDEGLRELQRAVDAGWRFYSYGALNDPFFDPYRDDPRFEEAYRTVQEDMAEQLAWFDAHRDAPVASVEL